MVKTIPEGYHTVTPSILFKDSQKAIEFYKKAFGATVLEVFPNLNGRGVMHAAIKIGNSIVMVGDEMVDHNMKSAETIGYSPITLYLYVQNVDTMFKQAVAAGGKAIMPVKDMFWGDRSGTIKDPFGYAWMIATHIKDMTMDEMIIGAKVFASEMANK